MTIPGIFLVDRAGRRPLLMAGAIGMLLSEFSASAHPRILLTIDRAGQFIVAIVGTVIGDGNPAGQQVLIAFVCIFIAFFAATWGPLAWVVTSEVYSTSMRAKAMSMSTAANWLANFAIGFGSFQHPFLSCHR